jgi:hypothetical protein
VLVPTFYLNFCNGSEVAEDEEGVELSDFAVAHRQGVNGLRDVMAGDLLRGDLNTASFVEIEDEQHQLLGTVFFKDVVELRNEPCERQSRSGKGGNPPD